MTYAEHIQLNDIYTFFNTGLNPQLFADNSFLNNDRYTDICGGQEYENNYLIDHHTGMGWDFKGESIKNLIQK